MGRAAKGAEIVPLYVYKRVCNGTTFEVVQPISDEPLTHDENGNEVVRVPQAPAIKFNGPGFYTTDYA